LDLGPSLGGMLIQSIIAIVAGFSVIIFGMRRKIIASFKKNKNAAPASINRQSSEDDEIVDMLSD
jgi:hypothetical protein